MLSTDRSNHLLAHRRPLYPISGNAAYTMNGAVNGTISYPPHIEHIWIITGPAGCGKTTVAKYLAKELSLPYVEGDDVWTTHPYSKQWTDNSLVPLGFKQREDGEEYTPHRCRPLGLAHNPARRSHQALAIFEFRHSDLLSFEAQIPRRDPCCKLRASDRSNPFHIPPSRRTYIAAASGGKSGALHERGDGA